MEHKSILIQTEEKVRVLQCQLINIAVYCLHNQYRIGVAMQYAINSDNRFIDHGLFDNKKIYYVQNTTVQVL